MRRKLMDKLIQWKEEYENNFCMLYGASGVGKSYLAYEYGRNYYTQFIYLDFKRNKSEIDTLLGIRSLESLNQLFEPLNKELEEKNIDINEDDSYGSEVAISMDSSSCDETSNQKELLIILDHMNVIQELSMIKKRDYIFEQLNGFIHFIAGNRSVRLIGISSEIICTPCEKELVTNLNLYPLDFEEYLDALGYEWYIDSIKGHFNTNTKLPDIVHNELLTIFDQYLDVGGMPIAINELISTHATFNVAYGHLLVEHSYLHKVRNQNDSDGFKILQVYESIPKQLLKQNRKFQYNRIRKGATCTIYSSAIEYMNRTFHGLISIKLSEEEIDRLKVGSTYLERIMDNDSIDYHNIKMYHYDVGILNSSLHTYCESNQQIEEDKQEEMVSHDEMIRCALVENYVAINLANNGHPLIFWESNSIAKIEFIIQKDNRIIPVEVRANDKTRSKNFSVYKTQYSTGKEQIKISTKNFEYANRVKYVPIYAVFCI